MNERINTEGIQVKLKVHDQLNCLKKIYIFLSAWFNLIKFNSSLNKNKLMLYIYIDEHLINCKKNLLNLLKEMGLDEEETIEKYNFQLNLSFLTSSIVNSKLYLCELKSKLKVSLANIGLTIIQLFESES